MITESTVYIPEESYEVVENIGKLKIPIQRKGDISKEMMVVCFTESGINICNTVSFLSDFNRIFWHNS